MRPHITPGIGPSFGKKFAIRAYAPGYSHSAPCKAVRLPLAQRVQRESLSGRPATRKSHSAAGSAEDRGSLVADALATSSNPVAGMHAGSSPLHSACRFVYRESLEGNFRMRNLVGVAVPRTPLFPTRDSGPSALKRCPDSTRPVHRSDR